MTCDHAAAVAIAARRCVHAANLLAAARVLHAGGTRAELAAALAASTVCGWADADTRGTADATGIIVTGRTDPVAHRVRWADVADIVRRGLTPGMAKDLAAAYDRYVTAATAPAGSHHLETRVRRIQVAQATAELHAIRDRILDAGTGTAPAQQALFTLASSEGISR